VSRQAQAVVLLLLGGAVLKTSLTGGYLRYVKEGLQPFLVAASVLLMVAAAVALWQEVRGVRTGEATGHAHGDGSHREPRVGWLLLAPALGLLLVAPPALGSYTASTAGTSLTPERAADLPPLPDAPVVELAVLDYAARAIWDGGDSLAGHRVLLTGFLLTGRDGEPYLARLVLSCCAADARPVKIGLAGAAPAGLADDTWVEVIGTYTGRTAVDPINEATIPFLLVESWREVPAPARPYE
jgi:uncharacterized repeat protein (TIGR03943 family)